MVGLAENVQACLRIFRRAQHLWLARDILHLSQAINKDKHQSCGWYPTTGMTATCTARRFISVYRLGEDGDLLKEGDGMIPVWALRASSYKTRAEA